MEEQEKDMKKEEEQKNEKGKSRRRAGLEEREVAGGRAGQEL